MEKVTETTTNTAEIPLDIALGERYLAYAMSTITSRSLPDVRDGLKPVHRRLLFAMQQLNLDPRTGFKKCARVVGDVIGKYHPHGDTAVYDALVRMAQEFAARFPLIEGQGNFGNLDGDSAAAMRYTEARLTDYALAMLDGINQDAVSFQENYDGTEDEPALMPAAVPNLLANGATGIAVGMATSIPPHNLDEICQALIHLIKYPKATLDKILSFMPGPDFPTGGILAEAPNLIKKSYSTGRGSFRLRARWEVENLGRGLWQIVVSEIPYQVQKGRLVEKIAELLLEKKLPLLEDVRDESSADVRLVLEPRTRSISPEILMEALFQNTDLEVRVGLNLNVLNSKKIPGVLDLRSVLQAYLDHRHEVLTRRSQNQLNKIEKRLEVLDGYMLVYLNIDEVILIIREDDDPKTIMMNKWRLSERQVEAILNIRLRALRKLEEIKLRKEITELEKERDQLNFLLKNQTMRWKKISEELSEIRKKFGKKTELGKRRTEIGTAPSAKILPLVAVTEKEPITVICSQKGWIKAIKGHIEDLSAVKFKEGDRFRFALKAETTDKVLIFGTNGRFYTIGCDKLPGGRGQGEPVRLLVGLGNDHEIVDLLIYKPKQKLLVVASDGRGFVVSEDEVIAQTRSGKQVLNVPNAIKACACSALPENSDFVAVIGDNHKMLIFPLREIPEMSRGRGVKLQSYKDGGLSDVKVFNISDGLVWKTGQRSRRETNLRDWFGKRAQFGRLAPKGFSRLNKF